MFKSGAVTVVLAGILAIALFATPVVAQNYWMHPGEGTSVSLEIFKPKFDDFEAFDLMTSVWLLSASIETSERMTLVLDYPIANLDVKENYGGDAATLFANPYVGFEYKLGSLDEKETLLVRVGIRLPLASDNKYGVASIGAWTLYDRFEAFVPDLLTIVEGFGWRKELSSSGIEQKSNVNFAIMIPTEDGEAELFGDYNFAFWFPVQTLNLGIGLSGRIIVTEGDLDILERTFHHVRLSGNIAAGKFKPGFHMQVPTDELLADIVDFSYGVNLTYLIK